MGNKKEENDYTTSIDDIVANSENEVVLILPEEAQTYQNFALLPFYEMFYGRVIIE